MKYVRETTDIQITEPTVISLGKFDGLHMGHKLLLENMMTKKQEGLATVMFTFDIPPKTIVNSEVASVLTTREEKEDIFNETGIDYLIEYPFTKQVQEMEPEAFIRMLVEKLNVKCVVAGRDFHFGHNRRGNYETLQKYGPIYGFETVIVEKKTYENRDISSTFIREEIINGNIEKANLLLGYEYFVKGTVVHGKKLGRELGIPTINQIPPEEKLLPPFGVYVSRVIIDNENYGGITNVGRKPTIEGANPIGVETNIFEFDGDLYGKEVKVQFLKFIRNERKFQSVSELKEQMQEDIRKGKEYLKNNMLRKCYKSVDV